MVVMWCESCSSLGCTLMCEREREREREPRPSPGASRRCHTERDVIRSVGQDVARAVMSRAGRVGVLVVARGLQARSCAGPGRASTAWRDYPLLCDYLLYE